MIRFDRFMETALHHPEGGYYASRIRSVGKRGDFTTTSEVSPILAKAIAHQFSQSGFSHLIELGAGTGKLAKEVWKELSFFQRRKTHFHLVDTSVPLSELQAQTFPQAKNHPTVPSALAASQGKAFVYSNELVDAFAARIFRREETGWSELFLSGKQPDLQEEFQVAETLPDSTLFGHSFQKGQRVEVHESYRDWLASWLPDFRGQLLTIDYVAPNPRPMNGTLRGYFQHDRLTGGNLYRNAGQIDITADVHFDDLERWGEEWKLKRAFRKSQEAFLTPFAKDSNADRYLTNPDGAGAAFEVLLQECT